MKAIGFLLLIGGFLGGAFATALDTQATNWTIFFPAAIAALIGVILIKRESSGAARSTEVLTGNRKELADSLRNIVQILEGLLARDSSRGGEMRDMIDNRLRVELQRFADARESLIHIFDLQTYADIMSEFAAGERYVNRVWSASADGYEQEASDYLQRALGQFREASAQLQRAEATTP
jgi:hypothetical protein